MSEVVYKVNLNHLEGLIALKKTSLNNSFLISWYNFVGRKQTWKQTYTSNHSGKISCIKTL